MVLHFASSKVILCFRFQNSRRALPVISVCINYTVKLSWVDLSSWLWLFYMQCDVVPSEILYYALGIDDLLPRWFLSCNQSYSIFLRLTRLCFCQSLTRILKEFIDGCRVSRNPLQELVFTSSRMCTFHKLNMRPSRSSNTIIVNDHVLW